MNVSAFVSRRRCGGERGCCDRPATDAVIEGGYDNAFCSVRPARSSRRTLGRARDGVLLLHNIAVGRAATVAAGLGGGGGSARPARRRGDRDFDVHHGNGHGSRCSRATPARPDVQILPASVIFRIPGAGTRKGAGNMVKWPMAARNGGHGPCARRWICCWLPRLDAFKPCDVFVSRGFGRRIARTISANHGPRRGTIKLCSRHQIARCDRHSNGAFVS